jgi:8-oxo-dGTP diphosphatase
VTLRVVAGALYDARGRVLIAQRPVGKALAGRWEFPGGKLHEGEAAYDGLVRELREELGVEVHAAERLLRYEYAYPERVIELDLWTVNDWRGTPRGLDGQALDWIEPARLHEADILEADRPMIAALVRTAGSDSTSDVDGERHTGASRESNEVRPHGKHPRP